jgi:hypothetical protein
MEVGRKYSKHEERSRGYETMTLKARPRSAVKFWELLRLRGSGAGMFRDQVDLLINADLQDGLSQSNGQFVVADNIKSGRRFDGIARKLP